MLNGPIHPLVAFGAGIANDKVKRRPPAGAREKRATCAGVRLNAMLGLPLGYATKFGELIEHGLARLD
jgi:hypothetical protein